MKSLGTPLREASLSKQTYMISATIKMRQPPHAMPDTDRSKLHHYRGSGFFMLASAYPITAIAAPFSRSSLGTTLSSVSAAVWW
jgi:hypothetical protein